MRRPTKNVSPGADALEPRALPSTVLPLWSTAAPHPIVREVRAIVRTLGATGDLAAAQARLDGLAAQVAPPGSGALALAWQGDLALYRQGRPGDVAALRHRLLADLDRDLPPPPGPTIPGSPHGPCPGPGSPAPALSLDSVQVQNQTGLNLKVTVVLETPQVQQPSITRNIAAGGPVTAFDFGTATGDFMKISVSRADGLTPPNPFPNFQLPMPTGGYRGALFTVTVFGSSYNISLA